MPFFLKTCTGLAEMVAKLLHPFAEVVVHDLKKNQIAAIFNAFSKRAIGEPSYLDQSDFNKKASPTILGPYKKVNFDGRPQKSIS